MASRRTARVVIPAAVMAGNTGWIQAAAAAGMTADPDMRSLFSLLPGWNGRLSAVLALRGCSWGPWASARLQPAGCRRGTLAWVS